MDVSIEVVRNGSRLAEIGAGAFLDFINPIIAEKAMIMVQKESTMAEEEEWLKKSAKAMDDGKKLFVIAFSGNRIVGNCESKKGSLQPYEHNVDFGLSVSKEFRGRGLGRRLLQTAMEEGRKAFSPRKTMIEYIDGNEPARRLYESVGFREVCRLRKHFCHYGEFRDKIVMELADK
jgi:RimJ/RimL family protein N-acetyltransferase